MEGNRGRKEAAVPEGSLLRLGEAREIAFYRRDGAAWVADFRGGRGELFAAGAWFALKGRGSVLRRAGLDSVAPLPARVVERIERLHAAEVSLLADLVALLRDGLAKLSSELSCRVRPGAFGPRAQHG